LLAYCPDRRKAGFDGQPPGVRPRVIVAFAEATPASQATGPDLTSDESTPQRRALITLGLFCLGWEALHYRASRSSSRP
jgi:hypothetical protein